MAFHVNPAHLASLITFYSPPCAFYSSVLLHTACLCIYSFLCLYCTLLCSLDTLLLKIWSGITVCLKLFLIPFKNWSFVFLLNLLPVSMFCIMIICTLSSRLQVVSYFSLKPFHLAQYLDHKKCLLNIGELNQNWTFFVLPTVSTTESLWTNICVMRCKWIKWKCT